MRLIFSETYDQSSSFANSSRILSSLISTTFLLDVSIFQSRKSLYSLTNERSICWFLESALQFISAPFSHACLRESIDGIKDGLLDKLNQLKLMSFIKSSSASLKCNSLFDTTSSQDIEDFISESFKSSRSFVSSHLILEFFESAFQSHAFSLFSKINPNEIFVLLFADKAFQFHSSSMKL